jgi:cytochrome c556
MNRTRLALLGIAVAGILGVARAQEPAFNIIETRQAGQDLLAGTFTGISEGIKHKVEVKAFEHPAAALARWMKQFPSTFPPGSDHGNNTKALPAIWSNRAGFDQAADNFVSAADKLAQLAKADDTAGFTAQVQTVGQACKACHDKFRAK